MDNLYELKSQVRDFTLEEITRGFDLKLNINKRFNKRFQIWFPNRKLINYLTKNGAVLTGSRALKCYSFKDKELLPRPCSGSDWDFVITRKMMYKLSEDLNMPYNLIDRFITVSKHKYRVHPAYSDSYSVGQVDVHIIIADELPPFIEKNGVRITPFSFTLNEKVKLLDEIVSDQKYSTSNKMKSEADKHKKDLQEIIIRLRNC